MMYILSEKTLKIVPKIIVFFSSNFCNSEMVLNDHILWWYVVTLKV